MRFMTLIINENLGISLLNLYLEIIPAKLMIIKSLNCKHDEYIHKKIHRLKKFIPMVQIHYRCEDHIKILYFFGCL